MKPSKRVQRVIILVAILLLFGGLSGAQEPNRKDWGTAANGLQMRISLDQAVIGQSEVPKFRVELCNVGGKDLLLNLGTKEPRRATPISDCCFLGPCRCAGRVAVA